MLNKFNDKAQRIIALSESVAFELGHSNVGSEHLLLALCKSKDSKLKVLLEKENITYDSLKDEIISLFGKKNSKPFYMEYTDSFKKILENAVVLSRKKQEDKVSIDALSVSMLESNESIAKEILQKRVDNLSKVVDELKKQIKKTSELDSVFDLTNLNNKAQKNTPILIHRENEINLLTEILLRKQKQNAIIVGESGVGKTALVEYLAYLITKQKVPTALKDKTIYELDISSIIAGTKYRGEFEDKLKKILKKVKEDKNAILFIDEIHNIIGAGGAEGAIDASNILKPYLSRGEICCIGATTYDEYIKLFEKEKALERRFQMLYLKEPNLNETIDILLALKDSFCKYHNIVIKNEIIYDVVKLCNQYVFDRKFPDKAIDVLDIACVKAKNSNEKELTFSILVEVIEKNYNVKIELTNKAKTLQINLNKILLGQEEPIEKIINHIKLIELGINENNRPLGVFLFVGATGVGKTETAKQIAKYYFGSDSKYIKLDMSEYSETACVNKLIGSPPGYVGFERQSLLVDHIRTNPHSVVVLDEVEKAHRDILDVFLNVFDEGYFYDACKRKIDFSNSIIIMTSNLGFSEETFHKKTVGFVDNFKGDAIKSVLKRHFRPEFLNRIDEVICFNNLSTQTCKNLTCRYVEEFEKRLCRTLNQNEIIEKVLINNEAIRYGARGIKRAIKQEILNQLKQVESI